MTASLVAACPAPAAQWPGRDAGEIQGAKLYDLGVADANADGALDVFTINHKFESSLLLGDGEGGLSESTAALRLNPTPAFPGLEAIRREPVPTSPGLYIHATDRDEPRDPLHIDTIGIPASGRLVFATADLRIEQTGGATVTETPVDGLTVLDFDAGAGQSIAVSVDHIDLPISVAIDPPTAPAEIRVGADAIPATSRSFELNLRDRHGYAFGDYDSDGRTDLFVASGGLGGDIAEPFYTPFARDELLLNRSGAYENVTASSGLVKGDCRGRSALTADVDADGDLDVLETCEGSAPRLWAGDGAGNFASVPAPPAPGSAHRFADLTGDRRLELVAANGAALELWRPESGAWALVSSVPLRNVGFDVDHLALGDLEGDGDLDAFTASAGGNTLVRAGRRGLRSVDPARYRLPRTARALSFVDYDNDGDADAHLMPQGLFEWRKGRFRRTGDLDYGRTDLAYAIDNWVDLDGDGRREPLTARGRDEFASNQTVELRRNNVRGGHWLELDLRGPAGNRQAIGASAKARVGERWIHQWVGQNDDSRHSSGHYRLYFGLGDERRIDKLAITWPDGSKRVIRNLRADRVLRIAQTGAGRAGATQRGPG